MKEADADAEEDAEEEAAEDDTRTFPSKGSTFMAVDWGPGRIRTESWISDIVFVCLEMRDDDQEKTTYCVLSHKRAYC